MTLTVSQRSADHLVVQRGSPLAALSRVAAELSDRRMWAQAETLYRYVIAQEPGNARALNNLSIVRACLGDLDEAIRLSKQCVALRPEDVQYRTNLATKLMDLGRFAEAEAEYRNALTIDPDQVHANGSLGILLLRTGRFREAWAHYLKRERPKRYSFLAEAPAPWQGQDLVGKSLLILGEQGLGEAFQIARLFPRITALCSEVTFVCEPRLAGLFQRSFPTVQLISQDDRKAISDAAAAADCTVYMMDLLSGLAPDGRPAGSMQTCLKPDAARVATLRRGYLNKFPGKRLIGFTWSTSSSFKQAARTIPVPEWREILSRGDCQFFSLQYGSDPAVLQAAASKLGVSIEIDPTVNARNDIDGLAAQICALDQIISIDNTTVHLAGALGKPVWTLLMKYPHWLWGLKGARSHWYPSMRLFRQKQDGAWSPVLDKVSRSLDGIDQPAVISAPYRGKLRRPA
ncbi:MAG: tetratricopeptide repeat protein [Pseudomonadota bacterium]